MLMTPKSPSVVTTSPSLRLLSTWSLTISPRMSQARQSRSLTLSELQVLTLSSHLPKTEAQSHCRSHIHLMCTPNTSLRLSRLSSLSLLPSSGLFTSALEEPPHYSFWLVSASVSCLHSLLPMATRLFPKHLPNDVFPEKPKMVLPSLQDNLRTAFKYFMVWPQLCLPTLSLSLIFLPKHPTSQCICYSPNVLLVFSYLCICVSLSPYSECSLLLFVHLKAWKLQFML